MGGVKDFMKLSRFTKKKCVEVGGWVGRSKNIKYCVTPFMDDPLCLTVSNPSGNCKWHTEKRSDTRKAFFAGSDVRARGSFGCS